MKYLRVYEDCEACGGTGSVESPPGVGHMCIYCDEGRTPQWVPLQEILDECAKRIKKDARDVYLRRNALCMGAD